jgi:hypothetical protein
MNTALNAAGQGRHYRIIVGNNPVNFRDSLGLAYVSLHHGRVERWIEDKILDALNFLFPTNYCGKKECPEGIWLGHGVDFDVMPVAVGGGFRTRRYKCLTRPEVECTTIDLCLEVGLAIDVGIEAKGAVVGDAPSAGFIKGSRQGVVVGGFKLGPGGSYGVDGPNEAIEWGAGLGVAIGFKRDIGCVTIWSTCE